MSAKRKRLSPANIVDARIEFADSLARMCTGAHDDGATSDEDYAYQLRVVSDMRVAPAWWATADMVRLAMVAAMDGTPRAMPQGDTGFMVFAEPVPYDFAGTNARPRAFSWHVDGREVAVTWLTSDRDWLWDESVSLSLMSIEAMGDAAGDGGETVLDKLAFAIFALTTQPGIVDVRTETQRRQVNVRDATRRHDQADPLTRTVKFLLVHDHEDEGSEPLGGKRGPLTHRFIVRGHWTHQVCGPKRAQRRVQWIAPFVKGPSGAPLVVRETVRIWKDQPKPPDVDAL